MTNAQQIEEFLKISRSILADIKNPNASSSDIGKKLDRATNIIARSARK